MFHLRPLPLGMFAANSANSSSVTRGKRPSNSLVLPKELAFACLALSDLTSARIRSAAKTPSLKTTPSISRVAFLEENFEAASVDRERSASWRQTRAQSLVKTASHSMKSAPFFFFEVEGEGEVS